MRSLVAHILAALALLRTSDAFQATKPSCCNRIARRYASHPTPSPAFLSSLSRCQSSQLYTTSSENRETEVDVDALVKYGVAGIVQMAGFAVILSALDKGVEATSAHLPLWASGVFFYACSLKSRVLNPLNNQRPKVESPTNSTIIRPSWFPPGVIFPIMWILIIGPIRAYSSALVYDATGEFMNLATLSFLFHLTMGDIWNTINNVEKRLGAAASTVIFVILSAVNASYQYYEVDATAGELLGLTLLWLCTAGALVASIWQLNPDEATGQNDAPFPVKGNAETRFSWFSGNE